MIKIQVHWYLTSTYTAEVTAATGRTLIGSYNWAVMFVGWLVNGNIFFQWSTICWHWYFLLYVLFHILVKSINSIQKFCKRLRKDKKVVQISTRNWKKNIALIYFFSLNFVTYYNHEIWEKKSRGAFKVERVNWAIKSKSPKKHL